MNYSNIKDVLPSKLLDLRRRAGFSQETLGEKIGVTKGAISGWETGKMMPTLENLISISDVYGVTLNDLVYEKNPSTQIDGTTEEQFSDVLFRIGYGVIRLGFNAVHVSNGDVNQVMFSHRGIHYNNNIWDDAVEEFSSIRSSMNNFTEEQVLAAVSNVAKRYAKMIVESDLFRLSHARR